MPSGSIALRDSEVGEGLYRIGGQVLQPKHLQAFKTYTQVFSFEKVAKLTGIAVRTLYEWRRQAWWKELHQTFIEDKQEEFYLKMCARADEIMEGYFAVVTGQDKGDKTAGARIQAAKLFMEAGENPILKKPGLTITHNKQVNMIGQLDEEKLHLLTSEELTNLALGGAIPEKVMKT